MSRTLVSCARCAGTGEYPPTDGDECSFCGGTGEVVGCVDCENGADLLRSEVCDSCGRRAEGGLCFRCSIGQHDKCDTERCSHLRSDSHAPCACEVSDG